MIPTAIIGAGNMGSALYKGLANDKVFLCDRDTEKISIATENNRSTNILEATENAECIIIAVKPQSFDELMTSVKDSWSDKFIISIMAGVSLSSLAKKTGSPNIVRAMPNLGVLKGQGMTGWCATPDVPAEHRKHAEEIFAAVGESIFLDDEDKIDAFTAIAGSGPAYVFALAEQLQNAAEQLGLSSDESALIARKIIAAGSALLDEGSKSAKEWREAVTSKGGVTQAVLEVLKNKGVDAAFQEALESGTLRSRSLSSENG